MKRIRALIIDDEKGSIDSLVWELEAFSHVDIIATTTDPVEGIELLNSSEIDVLFLDIEMPTMTGFQLLQKIDKVNFNVIFTTAYDSYALKAFEVSALDYLMKPVDEDDLARALSKVSSVDGENETIQRLTELYEKMNADSKRKNLALPTQDGLHFVSVDQIVHCESDSNYTKLHFDNEKPMLVSKTLKDIETMIDSDEFFRIHHSHLINLNFLKKYNRGLSGSVELKNGNIIPVSRSRKSSFLEKL